MKKVLILTTALVMSFGVSKASVHAANLTPEQQAVINSYENATVINNDTQSKPFGVATVASSGVKTYRSTYYRGSVLMWTRDIVSWSMKNGKLASSSGSQEAGYIFPNIARAKGISKYSSSSSSVTYRAKKVIGAGIVSPWGDVTIYEQAYTDYLKANSNGILTLVN